MKRHVLSDSSNVHNNIEFIKKQISNNNDIVNEIKLLIGTQTCNDIYDITSDIYYINDSNINRIKTNITININDNDTLIETLNMFSDKNISKDVNSAIIYIDDTLININHILCNFTYIKELEIIYYDFEDPPTNIYDIEQINVKLENVETINVCSSIFLPDDINNYFPSLNELTIYIDDIDDIKNIKNKTITKLERLKIYSNGYFDDDEQINLNIKNLISNNLKYFHADIDSGIDSQIVVDMSTFMNCKNTIEHIEISCCIVNNLMALNKFKNLQKLYLSKIQLNTRIDLDISLNNLINFNISFNSFNNPFNNLILNLPNCNVIKLYKCLNNEPLLINCENLKTLDLSTNRITSLSAKLFISIPNIEYLDCSNNKINKISELINSCKNLIDLNLDDNNIKILPDNLKYLIKINCNNNPLISISNIVFENIERISINNTCIKQLKLNNNKKLLNLDTIYCDIDKIEYISNDLIHYCNAR